MSCVVYFAAVSCACYRSLLFIFLRLPACNTCKYNLNLLCTRNKIAQPEVNKLVFFTKCVSIDFISAIHQLSTSYSNHFSVLCPWELLHNQLTR